MSSASGNYSESDDDVPLASQSRNGSQRQAASTNGKHVVDSDHDDSPLSDDDLPLVCVPTRRV
jgi:hypothetical protein